MKEASYSDSRFWCSYILFITIIGRILVLFIYITRLASNEIFSPSNKIYREVGRAKDLSAPRYFTSESHVTFNLSQITDQYSAGIGPKCTWTAFWLSSHTKLKLYKWFLFTVRIVKILQFYHWLHLSQHETEGNITEFLLCVGWLGYNGSAVRGYLMRCFWIGIAVWLVLDLLDF